MLCNICSQKTTPFAQGKILRQYDVQYFQCDNCGFIQTEKPYWIEEAYSSAIAEIDIGSVNRSIVFSEISKTLILACFDSNSKFVDYGAGYGLFVRRMRDLGFDFYYYDKHCENLFTQRFEINFSLLNLHEYELVTAFEVFEHLVHPLEGVEEILKFSKNIFFSTVLVPANNPKPGEWVYYAPEYGQHISFYTQKSLLTIAEKFKLNLYTDGESIHLLTEKKISPFLFKAVLHPKVARILKILLRSRQKKPSLLGEDFHEGVRLATERLDRE